MASIVTSSNNKLIVFRKELIREYIRENLFSPYMDTSPNAIIRVIQDLKKGGEQINIPLVSKLKQRAVGVGPLVGNEEAIDNYGLRGWIDYARNAIKINNAEEHKSSIDIYGEAKPLLSDWGKELIKFEVIDAFFALPSTAAPAGLGTNYGQRVNGVLFDAATMAQRSTWALDNADRQMFGGAQNNYVPGNFGASCANITAAMTLSASGLNKMKRLAKKASPAIRPYMTKENREYFMVFAGSNCFRDLQNDQTIINANTQARAREGNGMDKNPLFQDGDLMYNGMIIREIPEMDTRCPVFYATAGNNGTPISPVFLCGQSAMAHMWGEMPKPTFLQENDYGFVRGAGVQMAYGIMKVFKATPQSNLREWGVFTGFFASQNDQ